ncbi:HdaA/DnaA family protein [Rickettsia endosymbiont of Cardiosporidium cionae]|uniref:HdaA/DnaA family protein n=1 Tax=Rickettsia endosymbiont of Cardiosporidium cionae TaxID=2777155 RepID=UPI001893372D|nr:hypothetical protein [Rickettsia endosymbiont of Cardiosporidium cionae]KAF8818603.1 hypothetical protein IHI24_000322 [Rickettsia endosymbiont of Cardiosporidium cionae]
MILSQNILSLSPDNTYNTEDFIISSSNLNSYNLITNYTKIWGTEPFRNTLIIQGPKSSGKTYLGKIWQNLLKAEFINYKKKLNISWIKQLQGFIIDDFDNINWDEELLLRYFNIINEHKKYLLIFFTNIPNTKLPDLNSRIGATYKVKILMPDETFIKNLLVKNFSKYSINIEKEVIAYIVNILSREYFKIINFVKNVNEYSLQYKRKITIPLIKEIIALDRTF